MELLYSAIMYDGLWWLIIAAFIAGCVRGFSGFGTALIFIPLALIVVDYHIWPILMMTVFDMFGPVVLLPRAIRDGFKRDMVLLFVGAAITLPFGVYLLTRMDADVFRWLVCGLSFLMLAVLLSGWRYRGRLGMGSIFGVGAAGGFMGGVAGLPGPPIILTYMASTAPVKAIRGTAMVYLFSIDILLFPAFYFQGQLVLTPMVIGLILAVPYTLGGMLGTWIFNPEKEKIYRNVAYVLIGLSAFLSLADLLSTG